MRTDLFDFDLPEERIALRPCVPRDHARLLVVDPGKGAGPDGRGAPFVDRTVRDLAELFRPGDVLVLNDTRVIPAALKGVRMRGELRAGVSVNLLERVDRSSWQALAKPAKKMQPGDTVRFGNVNFKGSTEQLVATVSRKGDAGQVELAFNFGDEDLNAAIRQLGDMPLPPYIAGRRAPDAHDCDAYQTVYSASEGAVAAPTAGLHFTPELLSLLGKTGVETHTLTLHVGAGTFLPVKVDDTDDHVMHAEWGLLPAEVAAAINDARAQGRRIIAVGTTSLRLLESAARDDGSVHPFEGETSIFIRPGYRFKVVDALLTNFHLPRSTLFMLVCAFSGINVMRDAYAHAIAQNYRFYSYGDATLLFRNDDAEDV